MKPDLGQLCEAGTGTCLGTAQATRDVQAQLWAMCSLGSCGSSLKLAKLPGCPLLPAEN